MAGVGGGAGEESDVQRHFAFMELVKALLREIAEAGAPDGEARVAAARRTAEALAARIERCQQLLSGLPATDPVQAAQERLRDELEATLARKRALAQRYRLALLRRGANPQPLP
jgi:hypothetical protein